MTTIHIIVQQFDKDEGTMSSTRTELKSSELIRRIGEPTHAPERYDSDNAQLGETLRQLIRNLPKL